MMKVNKDIKCPRRYKWTMASTKLLVYKWSNDDIQKKMVKSSRNQFLWDAIGEFLTKKGHPVKGDQCRIRIKNMTKLYQSAVISGDTSQIDPYFNIFHQVISAKKMAMKNKKDAAAAQQKAHLETQNLGSVFNTDEENTSCEPTSDALPLQNQETEYDMQYLAVDPSTLDALIRKAVDSQLKPFKDFISESIERVETLIMMQREQFELMMAERDRKQQLLGVRLDRLLSRIEATAIPQLTYMGARIAEREAPEN